MSKRKGARSCDIEKNQKIRTRLIEISIKVENFIYNQEPITKKEAEMYMKEVNSYRAQCFQDERTLQVIEKLSRCMKAIIAEQEELNLSYNQSLKDNISTLGSRETSASPVYSLPDEDRTQFTQNEEVIADLQLPYEKCNDNLDRETQFTQDIHDVIFYDNNKDTTLDFRNTQIVERNLIAVDDRNELSSKTRQDEVISNPSSTNLTLKDTNYDDILSIENSPTLFNNMNSFHVLINPPIPNVDEIHTLSNNGVDIIDSANLIKSNQGQFLLLSKTPNLHEIAEPVLAKTAVVECSQALINNTNQLLLTNNIKKAILQKTEMFHMDFPGETIINNELVSQQTTKEELLLTNNSELNNQKPPVLNNSNLINNKLKVIKKATIIEKARSKNTLEDRKPTDSKRARKKQNITPLQTSTKLPNVINITHNATKNKKTITIVKKIKKPKQTITAIGGNKDNVKSTNNINKKLVSRKKKLTENKATDNNIIIKKKIIRIKVNQTNLRADEENNKSLVTQPGIKHPTKQSKVENNVIENKSPIPIYNKNVENDLSWVENIRFVREIAEDEYDRTLLTDENFWDNYCLPANFDQNDFL